MYYMCWYEHPWWNFEWEQFFKFLFYCCVEITRIPRLEQSWSQEVKKASTIQYGYKK